VKILAPAFKKGEIGSPLRTGDWGFLSGSKVARVTLKRNKEKMTCIKARSNVNQRKAPRELNLQTSDKAAPAIHPGKSIIFSQNKKKREGEDRGGRFPGKMSKKHPREPPRKGGDGLEEFG